MTISSGLFSTPMELRNEEFASSRMTRELAWSVFKVCILYSSSLSGVWLFNQFSSRVGCDVTVFRVNRVPMG